MNSHKNVNKVILVGNLGSDPELRQTNAGHAFTKLSLATSNNKKKADGAWEEQTQWHKAVVWGKLAETCCRYLKKGSRVYLEGGLNTHAWVDKDGNKRKNTEIIVDEIKFLGGKKEEVIEQVIN